MLASRAFVPRQRELVGASREAMTSTWASPTGTPDARVSWRRERHGPDVPAKPLPEPQPRRSSASPRPSSSDPRRSCTGPVASSRRAVRPARRCSSGWCARSGSGGFKDFKIAVAPGRKRRAGARRAGHLQRAHSIRGRRCRSRSRRSCRPTPRTSSRRCELLVGQPFDEVARRARSASLVTLLGMGASLSVASLAENVLARIGIPCRFSQDSHQQLLQMLQGSQRHVVMAFSFSGETRETTESLAVARAGRGSHDRVDGVRAVLGRQRGRHRDACSGREPDALSGRPRRCRAAVPA